MLKIYTIVCMLFDYKFANYNLIIELTIKLFKKLVENMNENTQQICESLRQFPRYAKLEPEALFAIVETAKELQIDPQKALTGWLSYEDGQVVMSIHVMHALIRSRKHSITRDKKSDDTICILHGRRADNGDTWVEGYSLEDARNEGYFPKPNEIFSKDMLFNRALQRLAMHLFSDVIGCCRISMHS